MWKAYAAQLKANKLKTKTKKEDSAAKVLQFNFREYLKRKHRLEEIRKIAEAKAIRDEAKRIEMDKEMIRKQKEEAEEAEKASRLIIEKQMLEKEIEQQRQQIEEEENMRKVSGCCISFKRR